MPPDVDPRAVRRQMARFRLFAAVFLVYLAYALADLRGSSPGLLLLAVALLALFVALYLGPLPVGAFLGVPWARGPSSSRWPR